MPRIFLLEDAYRTALLKSDLAWVQKLIADFASGTGSVCLPLPNVVVDRAALLDSGLRSLLHGVFSLDGGAPGN